MPFPVHRRLIVLVPMLGFAAAGAALGLAIGNAVEEYESVAVLRLAGPADGKAGELLPAQSISIPTYRRLRTVVANPSAFDRFAGRAWTDEPLQGRVRRLLQSEPMLSQSITPIFSQTRTDTRDVGESRLTPDMPMVTALRISFKAPAPDAARRGASLLAEYVRDSFLRDSLLTHIDNKVAAAQSTKLTAQANVLERQFVAEQIKATISDLKRLLQQYPSFARSEGRQVVSVQEGGGHYLSPIAQIVAAESRLSDVQREIEKLTRAATQADTVLSVLENWQARANDDTLQPATICDQILELLRSRLSSSKAEDDAVRAALHQLVAWVTALRSIYIESVRLLAEPTLPDEPTGITRLHLAVVGALVGFFLALALNVIRRSS